MAEEMQTNFPDGFQERFFTISNSNVPETLRREAENLIYVPCGMKHTQIDVPDKEDDPEGSTHKEDRYAWIECKIPWQGDDLSDQAAFQIARYKELREFFYGKPEHELEMQGHGEWTLHHLAVRRMFPKVAGQEPEEYLNWKKYRKQFWTLIKTTVEAKGHSFDEVPKDFFNAEWLEAKAIEIGCTQEEILALTIKIQNLTLNQLANGFTWTEAFFPYQDDINFVE